MLFHSDCITCIKVPKLDMADIQQTLKVEINRTVKKLNKMSTHPKIIW